MEAQKRLEIREHAGAIYSCQYYKQYLYSASADKFVTRWNIETGTQDKFAIKFEHAIYSITIYKDTLITGLNNGDIHFIDIEKRQETHYFQHHKSAIFALAVNSIKNHLYVGDADGNLSVWDLVNEKHLLNLPFDCGKIRDIAVDAHGERVAIACQDGHVRVIEVSSFNELSDIPINKDGVNAVLFHPEKQEELLIGGKDAHLDLWTIGGKRLLHIPAHNFAIYRIRSIGDKLITASRDASIKVWDSELNFKLKLDAKWKGHSHSINDLTVIDSQSFASCSDDRRLIVWKLT